MPCFFGTRGVYTAKKDCSFVAGQGDAASVSGEIEWEFWIPQAQRKSRNSRVCVGEGGRSRKLAQGHEQFREMARENFAPCLHVRRVHAARLSPTFPARFQRTPESNFLWLSRLCLLVASFPTISSLSRGTEPPPPPLGLVFRFICNWNADKNGRAMGFY